MEKVAFENPTCMRCGTDLVLMREEEDINEKEYKCPHCGTIHLFYPCAEEDQENYAWYNDEIEDNLGGSSHGYDGYCPQCGSHIVWQNDFMRSDIYGIDEGCELDKYGCPVDDSLVSEVACPHCGGSCTIIEALPSERHLYPAFHEKEEEGYD